MKILRRIPIAIAVLFAAQYFIVPAVVLHYVQKAPAITRVIPTELKDLSVSQAPGMKLSYLDYEFEVPWSDLDASQTRVSEGDKGWQTAWLSFRSGLKLFLSTSPDRDFQKYVLLKQTYAVTPDRIHYWTLFKGRHYRDARVLLAKSALLENVGFFKTNPAETGIFDVDGHGFKGFQYGDPQKRQPVLQLRLFFYDGSLELLILQNYYDNPVGVTQSEVNTIIQSLHKAVPSEPSKSPAAASN